VPEVVRVNSESESNRTQIALSTQRSFATVLRVRSRGDCPCERRALTNVSHLKSNQRCLTGLRACGSQGHRIQQDIEVRQPWVRESMIARRRCGGAQLAVNDGLPQPPGRAP
jgi:hypothetical protein